MIKFGEFHVTIKIKLRNMNKILLALMVVVLVASCGQKKKSLNSVTVSILPQKFIVEQLLGDGVEINVMIPDGNSPATYSPTPEQMKAVSSSSLYLKIGHIGFEQAWIEKFQSINGDLKVVDTSAGIQLIRGEGHQHGDHYHEGGIDPHIWTSPKTMLKVMKNTQVALIDKYPEQKDRILERGKLLESKIIELDESYSKAREEMISHKFIIFHPAYTYLARDYSLVQVSIEHMGKEPSAKWLKEIADMVKEENIKAIFIQREFDKRNAEMIATEAGIPVIQVNPLAENWDVEMRKTLDLLVKALS
ncbi:zinc ABC transporter substrate-binding protein [Labilibacter sediminis]|nr:zinc ABC transporter substrate-binding protein [Labilibacter sediminis]